MAAIINTNIASINSQRHLGNNTMGLETAMERLASGLRINSAADDAAGLAIADRMTAQVRGLNQAGRNANDAISVAQTAEGAMQEVSNILQRMRELAIQSANDTNSSQDRANLQKEVSQLQQELDRISETTTFNGRNLLDGTFNNAVFHIGAESNENLAINVGNTASDQMGNHGFESNGISAQPTGPGTGISDANLNSRITAQSLSISGEFGDASVSINAGDSAGRIADKVNAASDVTGVEADALTQVQISNVGFAGRGQFTLSGAEGVGQTISYNLDSTNDLTDLARAINDEFDTTGITAELSADQQSVTLRSEAGDDITIGNATSDGAVAADDGSNVFDVTGLNYDGTAASTVSLVGPNGGTDGNDSTRVSGDLLFESNSIFSVTTADDPNALAATTEAIVFTPDAADSTAASITIDGVTINVTAASDGNSGAFDIADLDAGIINAIETGALTGFTYASGALTRTDGASYDVSGTLDGTTTTFTITNDGGTTAQNIVGASTTVAADATGAGVTAAGILLSNNAAQLSSQQTVADVDISTQDGANLAINVIDGALAAITEERAALGAIQNRLDSTISNLSNTSENVTASRSRIQDADFASETAELSRSQVLQQAATSILAQANQQPQQVLSLLQ